jgi:lipopolysaccharide export system protein LptA
MTGGAVLAGALALAVLAPSAVTRAQQLDLTHGGPIDITASDGIEWRQDERQVIARGNARAVRQNVTVTGDRLTAFYRPKNGAEPPPQTGGGADADMGGNEIYRVQAEGHVHIFTATDQAQGDRAVYDIDQSVLVLTGRELRLTTPNDVLTARDSLEYWSQKHMAVARGNAVVVTNDGRRVAADTLVAYTTDAPAAPTGTAPAGATPTGATPTGAAPAGAVSAGAKPAADDPLGSSGKLEKVEAYGNVSVRTVTDTATGDRAVYVPDSGIARLAGRVRITRGQNQLEGPEAEVNMKTGISRLLAGTGGRVQGLVIPNDETSRQLTGSPAPGQPPPGRSGDADAGRTTGAAQ